MSFICSTRGPNIFILHFHDVDNFLNCNEISRVGIGALYVRRRPRVKIQAIQSGGGQERGIRSGTVPTPLVVGLGEACRIAKAEMKVGTTILTV